MHRRSEQGPADRRDGRRLRWLGPGFLWMVSAAGSGELLFSPRIGSLYGYSLLWAPLAGGIEAAHLPVLAGLTLYVNYRALPNDLRPSHVTTAFTALSALFFATFAAIYLYQLITGGSGS